MIMRGKSIMVIVLGIIFFVINAYCSAPEKGILEKITLKGSLSRSMSDIPSTGNPSGEPVVKKASSPAVMLSTKERGAQMFNLGIDCARRGDEEDAIRWFLEAAHCDESRAMNFVGMDYMHKGDMDKAKFWFSKGAALDNVVAKWNLASLYQQDDNLDAAVGLYKDILEHYPAAKNNLAVILYERGDQEGALHLWKEAKAEGALSAIFNLAWIADKQGDVEAAKAGYKQSADKGDPDGMFYLAMLYEREKDMLHAKYWYRKAAENGSEEALSKIKELSPEHMLRRKCKRKLSFMHSHKK